MTKIIIDIKEAETLQKETGITPKIIKAYVFDLPEVVEQKPVVEMVAEKLEEARKPGRPRGKK